MLKRENIRCVRCGAYQENAYLVCPEGHEDAFLVDPGDDLAALQGAIRESGRRLTAILLTHGHFDHMLAAQPLSELTGAAVYVHAADAEMLSDPDKSAYAPEVCRLAPPVGLAYKIYGDRLTVCGMELEVLSTPGHSRGSVCLRAGDFLFSGDTLFQAGYGRTDLHGGSDADMAQSLTRLLTKLPGETTVLPGHGGATVIAHERRRYGL